MLTPLLLTYNNHNDSRKHNFSHISNVILKNKISPFSTILHTDKIQPHPFIHELYFKTFTLLSSEHNTIQSTKLDSILPNNCILTSVYNYSISFINEHPPKSPRSHHTTVAKNNILPSLRVITSDKYRK